jgi:hypothetical protein
MEDKTFCTEWCQAFPNFNLLLISSWIEFLFVNVVPKYLNCSSLYNSVHTHTHPHNTHTHNHTYTQYTRTITHSHTHTHTHTPILLRFIFLLLSHLMPCLPSVHFFQVFPPKCHICSSPSPTRATCPTHLTPVFDLPNNIMCSTNHAAPLSLPHFLPWYLCSRPISQ